PPTSRRMSERQTLLAALSATPVSPPPGRRATRCRWSRLSPMRWRRPGTGKLPLTPCPTFALSLPSRLCVLSLRKEDRTHPEAKNPSTIVHQPSPINHQPSQGTKVPANLTPVYHEAERQFQQAETIPEKIEALQHMLAVIP